MPVEYDYYNSRNFIIKKIEIALPQSTQTKNSSIQRWREPRAWRFVCEVIMVEIQLGDKQHVREQMDSTAICLTVGDPLPHPHTKVYGACKFQKG